MGVDLITKNRITRWALKSKQLGSDCTILAAYNPEMGRVTAGSRTTANETVLKWELTVPLPKPEVEIVPFIIDWRQAEAHPHDELPHTDCKLVRLYGTHPNPDQFNKTFEKLGFDFQIEKSDEIALKAILKCAKGLVEI